MEKSTVNVDESVDYEVLEDTKEENVTVKPTVNKKRLLMVSTILLVLAGVSYVVKDRFASTNDVVEVTEEESNVQNA